MSSSDELVHLEIRYCFILTIFSIDSVILGDGFRGGYTEF